MQKCHQNREQLSFLSLNLALVTPILSECKSMGLQMRVMCWNAQVLVKQQPVLLRAHWQSNCCRTLVSEFLVT
jgi:hypothetical protein